MSRFRAVLPDRRLRRTGAFSAACALAVAGAVTSGAATSAVSAGQPVTITLYNAQHEQTTDAIVAAFTKQTGIKVRVENDDEDVLTAQIEQEGSRSPADVFYTENSNWLAQLDDRGLLARSIPRRWPTCRGATAPPTATGSAFGPHQRARLQPDKRQGLAAADLGAGPRRPRWKGKLELAPAETDFWPIVELGRAGQGPRRRAGVAQGAQGQRRRRRRRARQRDDRQRRQPRASPTCGLINHYYYYRLQAEVGKAPMHAQDRLLRAARSRATSRTSRARRC